MTPSSSSDRAQENLKTLNNSFALACAAAIGVALSRLTERPDLHATLFVIFLLLFRLKVWLDDGKFFATTNRRDTPPMFVLGLVLGVLSWLLFILAGSRVDKLQDSCLFLLAAVAVSTVWIVVAAVHDAKRWDIHPMMFFFNLLYAVGLWALLDTFPAPTSHASDVLVTVGLLVVLGLDGKASGTFDELVS